MAERDDLLASIAATTADYREGDLPTPTPQHVERWINQFDAGVLRRPAIPSHPCLSNQ